MKQLETIYNQAITDLTEYVVHITKDEKFEIAEKTTNNFEKFKAETIERNGNILVSSEGCTNTIYGNKFINILARVWHDRVHLEFDKDFSEHDEIKVASVQQLEVKEFITGKYNADRGYFAGLLIWLDIYEQVVYYKETGKFAENQAEFIKNKFMECIR